MNRKQLYNEITSLKLQEEVKNRYGKNYTQCTNEQLNTVITEVHKSMPTEVASSFQKLVDILAKKKVLLKSEVSAIMNA